jgi:hypothetical protein
MGPPHPKSPSAQLTEFKWWERGERRTGLGALEVAAGHFLRMSDPPILEALRLFWLCGESTGAGWEISHLASASVQPGTAVCRKVSQRPSSYLVPKTANVVIISESREPESKPWP